MQPTYNPWLGYFDLIDRTDIFVFLDNVQLVKRSWQVRNRIKTPQGEKFLTIPVITKGKRLKINETPINETTKWREKHLKTIEYNYKKAEHFEEVFPFIRELILYPAKTLGEFNINFITQIAKKIGITTKLIKASDLEPLEEKKDVLLANICKKIGCKKYISPQGSAEYLEAQTPGGAIVKSGIELYYHNYEHPTYNQLYPPFLPYMGIIDLLLNEGFEKALKIIRSGRRPEIHYSEFRKMLGK